MKRLGTGFKGKIWLDSDLAIYVAKTWMLLLRTNPMNWRLRLFESEPQWVAFWFSVSREFLKLQAGVCNYLKLTWNFSFSSKFATLRENLLKSSFSWLISSRSDVLFYCSWNFSKVKFRAVPIMSAIMKKLDRVSLLHDIIRNLIRLEATFDSGKFLLTQRWRVYWPAFPSSSRH